MHIASCWPVRCFACAECVAAAVAAIAAVVVLALAFVALAQQLLPPRQPSFGSALP